MKQTEPDRYSIPLTLGEFRKQTADLPNDTIFIERAHSEVRVIMLADFVATSEVGVDEDLLTEMDMEPADLGIPEGTDLENTKVIAFTAWD